MRRLLPWLVGWLVLGCGPRFVEPHPPELELIRRDLSPTAVKEPVVYAVIFDLHVADPAECQQQQADWLRTIRQALLVPGQRGREMAVMDVSPECEQVNARRLNVHALQTAWLRAEQEFPMFNVRPLIIYLNNINLGLPPELMNDLTSVSNTATPTMGLLPRFWVLAKPRVAEQLRANLQLEWTFAGDVALAQAFHQAVQKTLPLMSAGQPAQPVLDAKARSFEAFKVCRWDGRLEAPMASLDGGTQWVEAGFSWLARLEAGQPRAVDKEKFLLPSIEVLLEVCYAHCERYHRDLRSDELVHWSSAPGCVLANAGAVQ